MPVTLFADVNNIGLELLLPERACAGKIDTRSTATTPPAPRSPKQ